MTAVRTLLAVLVATALLGASMPAVEDVRTERTAAHLDATATRLVDAAAALVASDDPVPAGTVGAGRTVVVTLPRASVATRTADYLAIGGRPGDPDPDPGTVAYRVAGRAPRRIDARVRFVTDTGPEPLVLGAGRHRLRLTLVRTDAGVGVHVSSAGRRTFK